MERIAVIMGKMHSGGKKNLVMEYYRNIDRSKFQFDFICDSDSNAIPKEEIEQLGGRVFEVAPYSHIIKNMKDMDHIFKKEKYKIIHAYNGTMNLFPMYMAYKNRIPVRISESISMAHEDDKKTIIKNILKPFSKMFATHYMANGEACARYQFGDTFFEEGKVTVFKTVINTENNQFDPITREKTRRDLGIKDDSLLLGHIGRLTEQKNTLFIIDIFNEVLKIKPTTKLLIIGDGNLKNDMLKRIKEYGIENAVIYLGRREDIQKFYNAMDGFLLPSLYEGLPVVGVEAQDCGLPVFFSTEISKESSACDDLGFFISLKKTASQWAKEVIEKTKKAKIYRQGRREMLIKKGFDSKIEGSKLTNYYKDVSQRKL